MRDLHARARVGRIEPTVDAEEAWVDVVNEAAKKSLYMLANSWYLGANIPGKSGSSCPTSLAWMSTDSVATRSRRKITKASSWNVDAGKFQSSTVIST